MRRSSAIMLGACLCWASEARAQSVSGGARYEAYSLTNTDEIQVSSIRLFTVPFEASGQIGRALGVSVRGAFASGEFTTIGGGGSSLSGPVDTRIALDLGDGSIRLTASALLPTGDVVESAEDAMLVGLLSTDLMPFSVSQWGAGGGFSGELSAHMRPGPVAVHVSVRGSFLRESTATAIGPLSYQPGRELQLRWGVDVGVGSAGVLSLLAGYQRFDADTYDDADVFLAGSRIEGVASLAVPFGGRESALTYAGFYRLSGGEFPPGLGANPTDPVPILGLGARSARSLLMAGTEMRFARGDHVFVPRVDLRVLRNASGAGQGVLASVGGQVELGRLGSFLGRQVVLVPRARVHLGRLVAVEGLTSGIVGFEVGAVAVWGRGS